MVRLQRFIIGLFSLAIVLTLAGGLAFATGRAHPQGGMVYKIVGAAMVVTATAILGITVKRWAKWFFAVCLLTAAKSLFALVFGYTLSQPRLAPDPRLAALVFLLLVAMLLLSYRFVLRPPRSIVESVGLVGAVVGLVASMLTEPNFWPLVGAVLLMAISWVMDRTSGDHCPA
jgi:hypothetical protein